MENAWKNEERSVVSLTMLEVLQIKLISENCQSNTPKYIFNGCRRPYKRQKKASKLGVID